MAVLKDYKCPTHGYFEARKAQCPMKGCQEEVMVVHLSAPALVSKRTKGADKTLDGLAKQFNMGDIRSAKEGENQGNVLSRNNKFKKKEYDEAEAHLANKMGTEVTREARPGDQAIWGGGMAGMNLQSLISGGGPKSVRGEQVGMTPRDAGINSGPTIDPRATMRDPDNLKISR